MTSPSIALFGGAFDPVHEGHIQIANQAAIQFSLEKVIWVPTYHPPHREKSQTPFEHRLHMLRLALDNNPLFEVNEIEKNLPSPSYTIHTLIALQKIYTHYTWYLLIGADEWHGIDRWHEWEKLASLCQIAVYPRGKTPIGRPPHENAPTPIMIKGNLCSRSSSKLRSKTIVSGRNEFLPKLIPYIESNELYTSH